MTKIEQAVEREAEKIYEGMRKSDPEGARHPWVPGGNSLKQAEARFAARRIVNARFIDAGVAKSYPLSVRLILRLFPGVFKRVAQSAISRAYEDSLIDSRRLHEIAGIINRIVTQDENRL